jgi:hypothetical protein
MRPGSVGGVSRYRALAERGAKAGDVMMQRVARSGRKLVPPQAFDERVDVDHPALAERKHRQQRLTLRAAHLRERPARDNLEGAEKPDFQWGAHARRCVACTGESRRLEHAGEAGRFQRPWQSVARGWQSVGIARAHPPVDPTAKETQMNPPPNSGATPTAEPATVAAS